MNLDEKYKLANMAMEYALKNGADQVSVTISDSRNSQIEILNQKIDKLTESIRNTLSIELYVEKKYSSHSTSRLKKDDLLRFIGEAIVSTRYLAEDEFRLLPDPELYYKGDTPDLKINDPGLDGIDAKTKIDLATKIHDEAYQKDERIIAVTSSYSDNISNMVKVTSNGFKGDSSGSYVAAYVSVSVKDEKSRPSDYWYENTIFFNKLNAPGIGKKALERTIVKLGSKKIASGKYPVIFENRVASRILEPLFDSLSGYSIYQKQSFLAGKEGKPVASPLLTLHDDPLIISAVGSRAFDYEGLASVKRPIIEDGILRNFYIDTYYGRKLKMNPTTGNTSNVIFKTGQRDMNAMLKDIKKGILVTGFNGGNCNGTTGDFSYGIEGFYVEKGKIVHPVNEMNITGNMNDFWFNLAEVGNDIMENESTRVPSLMFNNIDFSGI
jgi:PmbA protein